MAVTFLSYRRPQVVSGGITFVGSVKGLGDPDTDIDLIPPTHTTDDFAVIFANGDSGVTDFSITGTGVTGWTELFDDAETSNGRTRRAAVFYKKFTSSSENTPTVTSANNDQIAASMHIFRGVDTTTPFDVTYSAGGGIGNHDRHGQNNYTFDIPPITTANANSCLIALANQSHADITAWGTPSGYTLGENYVADSAGRDHYNHAVAYQLDAGAAGVKSATAWGNTGTLSISDWSSRILALRAA